ncbi:MAG TPA: chemotaxis protein CheW [Gammaproteobacteria bacterium]
MSTTRKSIHDADALLLYQVGPVYCCSPTLPVESVIMPPRLTHPPGTTSSMPGVFKFSSGIVHVVDLRKRFGVDDEDRREPGRIVVVEVEGGHAGIWVDEIIDVIQFPSKGWGPVPAHIPRNVFSKTLLYDKKIMLYADFDDLHKFRESNYLRQHIEVLKKEIVQKEVLPGSVANKPEVKRPVEKKPLVKELPLDERLVNQHINNAPSVTKDNKQPNRIQARQPDLEQGNKMSRPQGNNAPTTPANTRDTQSFASRHSLAKTSPPETPKMEPHSSKLSAPDQNKKNTNIIPDSNKAKAQVKTHQENIKNFQSASVQQTKYAAASYSDKNDNSHSVDASMENEIPDNTGKLMSATAESNAAIWALGVVIMVMLLVLYYSFDKLFPEKIKSSPELVLNWQEAEDQVKDIQSNISEPIINESVINEPVVSEEPALVSKTTIANIQKPALDEYRADIAHDKNDVVIVLQQPEDEADVFKDEVKESGLKEFEFEMKEPGQSNEVQFQETENNNNEVAMDTVQIPAQKQENKSDSIITVKKVVGNTGESQDDSELPVLNQEKNASDQTQTSSPAMKTVEVKKQINKKQVIHIIVKGDTLWHIAKRYIKNPYKYPELARLSKIKNPDLIYPGNKVVIIIETKKTKRAN